MSFWSDNMSYNDHVAAGSSFCLLVDAAVMLYEQEYKSKHNHSTNLSAKEEEEEEDKSFFYNFPRKPRSSLTRFVTRRKYRKQIHKSLNESSSSLLRQRPFDLNSFPAAESETEEPLEGTPSLTLSLMTESEATNPTNPNPQKKTSSKRRAEQESKRKGKAKKAKVAPLSWKGREMPERLVQLMRDMKGSDPMLIFEKTLNQTDVNRYQSRLLMPFKTLIRNDFLTPVELSIVEEDDENNDQNIGVGSILVDQQNVKWGVIFKRRDMRKKDSGKVSLNYAFICGWNRMIAANGLKTNDSISVWSFRCRQVLCFAIVSPPTH